MGADRNPLAVVFGNNLSACRKRTRVSQEALGFLASLHRTEIGLLERGAREPRLGTIVKLAGPLSIPPEELFVGIEWKSKGANTGRFEFQGRGDVPAA